MTQVTVQASCHGRRVCQKRFSPTKVAAIDDKHAATPATIPDADPRPLGQLLAARSTASQNDSVDRSTPTRWEAAKAGHNVRALYRLAAEVRVLKKRLKRRRGGKAGRERRHNHQLRELLMEIKPWCVQCGRALQAHQHDADNFAHVFDGQLHCQRCNKQQRDAEALASMGIAEPPTVLTVVRVETVPAEPAAC